MKYQAFVISQCNWASEGVGYSDLRDDYGYQIGPGTTIYDYVNIRRTWGRHPDTGEFLWVDEPNTARRLQDVIEEGAANFGDVVRPPLNNPIDASIISCQISADEPVDDIDSDSKYLVWGLQSLLEEPTYPSGKEDWAMHLSVSTERRAAFNTFMEARGTDSQVLSDYWTANPDATYEQVANDFAFFI